MKNLMFFMFLMFFTVQSFSQFIYNNKQSMVVKAIVKDEFSGDVLGVNIELRNKDGAKIRLKSNSVDGKFEQILNAGESYTVIFTNYDIARKVDTLKIKDSSKYFEQKVEFFVKRLKSGTEIFKSNMFNTNDSSISEDGKKTLLSIQDAMLFNRSVRFSFIVNSHDSFGEQIINKIEPIKQDKKQKSKDSKKKKQETKFNTETVNIIIDEESAKKLVDARINVLKNLVDTWENYKDRIAVSGNYSIAPAPKPDTMLSDNYDFIVIVEKYSNVFE